MVHANHGKISRRRVVALGLAGATGTLPGWAADRLVATPRQGTGPFYPDRLPDDADNDLVRVAGRQTAALGTVLYVRGRLMDLSGHAIDGARVEIWQCDSHGTYHHVGDAGRRDPGFQGYGRTRTDADGAYWFRTIRPVPYASRAPHIHFLVAAPGFARFSTQMYVAGEARNQRDWLLKRAGDDAARARLIVPVAPADTVEAGALAGTFDIVLG